MAIDLHPRTILRLTGADRQRYLNGQVSNDVRKLDGTNTIPACVTTLKGKLDALVHITEIDDAYLIDTEAELRDSLHARLDKYIIADDCELTDASDDFHLIHTLTPTESDHPTRASQRLGQPGTDLWLPAGEKIPDLEFLTPEKILALRIQNTVPAWGAELTPDTLPAEAHLDTTAIDFHKGCYIGQEVISRIKSVGRVNRLLLRLQTTDGSPAPAPGTPIFQAEKQVGTITSAAGPDALAYIKRGHQDPGTQLTATDEKNLSTMLEIVDSQKN